ncbi:MAG: YbjP/YqhG family protein [Bacteroidales bacterium]|jgi:hypothetical protein|nr:YbjP/YqhG family protein [Bacteroidales bacterium]
MKKILLFTLLAIIAGGCKSKNSHTAEQILKEFYTQYITACDDMSDNTAIKENFLTRELITKLAEAKLDFDPLLNAQDCDKAWVETLEINPVSGQGMDNAYRICYDGGDAICLTLFLVQRSGKWLINDIEGLSDNNLEEAQHDNSEQKYLITDHAIDMFLIGGEIPHYSDRYSITKTIETRTEEGEEFEIPVYTVSENGQNLLNIKTEYDYNTEQFSEKVGSIYILSDKFKTAENIGLHSTIEEFMEAYPDFTIWYSYINRWYVIETKQFDFIQFFLDGNDFIEEGGPKFESDREILQPSEFKKGSTIKAIRIWG